MRDFEFAFNDNDFSDRVLQIEIMPDDSSVYEVGDPDHCLGKRKIRSQSLNKEIGDMAHSDDSDSGCNDGGKVTTLRISSPILAEKSPFFYKLFKNGMRESHQKHVTLKISASEEAALMDLLKFIYSNTLSAVIFPDLMDVLKVAHKFEVASCMKYCSELLLEKFPMSFEVAPLYLELPPSVLTAKEVQPLKDAAKEYLDGVYRLQKEAMALPLSAIEVVLRSDDLKLGTEDDVFKFIFKWAASHYPEEEERREILNKRLLQFIRFPYMSSLNLERVLISHWFNHEEVPNLVQEALFFKAGLSNGQCTNHRFKERAYKYRPIKVVQLEFPRPCCVVFFDLKKEECANLSPLSAGLVSQTFYLNSRKFSICARCIPEQENLCQHFSLAVGMDKNSETACDLDFEFEVMKKSSKEFESKFKVNNFTLTKGKFQLMRTHFGIPWCDFIAEDGEYFINGIVHLRAVLTMKNPANP